MMYYITETLVNSTNVSKNIVNIVNINVFNISLTLLDSKINKLWATVIILFIYK